MNDELVEATQDPSDTPKCPSNPTPEEKAALEINSETTKRGDSDESSLEEPVKASDLPETSDQDSDLDRGASPMQERSRELERLQSELIELREEIAKRDARLEEISKEYEEFNTLYPNTPLSSLQDHVWNDVRRGIPIAAAYALSQRRSEHTAQKALLSNLQNESRSAGALQPTQSDYFSPAEVRAMSQSEVRANYQKIMQSMQKWH